MPSNWDAPFLNDHVFNDQVFLEDVMLLIFYRCKNGPEKRDPLAA